MADANGTVSTALISQDICVKSVSVHYVVSQLHKYSMAIILCITSNCIAYTCASTCLGVQSIIHMHQLNICVVARQYLLRWYYYTISMVYGILLMVAGT